MRVTPLSRRRDSSSVFCPPPPRCGRFESGAAARDAVDAARVGLGLGKVWQPAAAASVDGLADAATAPPAMRAEPTFEARCVRCTRPFQARMHTC